MDISSFADSFDATTDSALEWLGDHGAVVFDICQKILGGLYGSIVWMLSAAPFYAVALIIAVIGVRLVNAWFGALTGIALLFCAFMGLWPETVSTLSLVLAATILALIVAIPAGILAGFVPAIDRFVEPILDLVQTLPPYIYLLPAIGLLGYGPATALVATIIVAVPPALRLASLGIRMTPLEFIELGKATGMTGWQMFWKIRLPFAMPSIMAGINQSLMMAFGMVVIAGIVGSGGLGETIYGAIRTLDIAKSIDAAIAIVILTMVLDRLTQSASRFRSGGTK